MEEKVTRLENEKGTLEQQLQNQTEELAAARQNTQTSHTKISIVEKLVLEQKNEIENLRRGLETFSDPKWCKRRCSLFSDGGNSEHDKKT